jgi:exodeoxyribonuclease-1
MAASFFFYDLETSGVNPREARIMQFAGQRTDMDLNPIGEPVNVLIKLSDDVVPEPDAILITGITPQQTIADGVTEAEFLKLFHEEVATPNTIFVGFNSVRFDDEFMRFLHYRNFYDPYEWQYTDGKSRWDLLDLVRMTRALRPEGIKWPVDVKGAPTNRLELLTKINGISHESAHDALSDVNASISLAALIKQKQPELFGYILKLRDKKQVAEVAEKGQPFVYTSGKYPSEFEKTTVVAPVVKHPKRQGVLVFDLRFDPMDFADMSVTDMVKSWRLKWNEEGVRLPIKTLQYNRCPAIAPLGVLDDKSAERLHLSKVTIEENFKKLKTANLAPKLLEALEQMDAQQQASFLQNEQEVDAQLYDGFIGDSDKTKSGVVRAASPEEISDLQLEFKDNRLTAMLPLYKARNFPKTMSDEERAAWEKFREHKLLGGKQNSRMARFFNRLAELAAKPGLTSKDQYLLEELQLYGQSIMPVAED